MQHYNKQMEQSVLSGLIAYPDLFDKTPDISDGLFTDNECKKVFHVVEQLHEKRRPFDIIILEQECNKLFPALDIMPLLSEIQSCYLTPEVIAEQCKTLAELSRKRQAAALFRTSIEKLQKEDCQDVMLEAQSTMNRLTPNERGKSVKDAINNLLESFKHAKKTGHLNIPSRWVQIQRKTGGARKGKMQIVAARPGIGKTTYACNEALNMAQNGFKVVFFTLEMDAEEIISKMACDISKVDWFKISIGDATPSEFAEFEKAAKFISRLPLLIFDQHMSVNHICNTIRNISNNTGCDVFFVDYIQLVGKDPSIKGSRREVIDDISKKLVTVAKETNSAAVILSQIHRGVEPPPNASEKERMHYIPKLHNLKESGSLEEDAFQVITLYNDPKDPDTASKQIACILVAEVVKNRGGPLGVCRMVFRKDIQKIMPETLFMSERNEEIKNQQLKQ